MFSPIYYERVLEPAYENWKRLYAADALDLHKAHLIALAARGIVAPGVAATLAAAIDAIEAEFEYPAALPEGVEDLYFVFERELERRAGAEQAAFLHTARSRNDMDTTVFRMALSRSLAGLCGRALEALRAMADRAAAGSSELILLYTHGQPANVSTMEHYLSAFASDFAEDLELLVEALKTVDRSTMGACAITGTAFPLDRGLVAKLLGFPSYVLNTYQAISTGHWLTRPAAALEELLFDLCRLVADLSHKASCEVGLVIFPDSLVQASSIMPQKRNPVILEHARIQSGLAAGACAAVRDLMRNLPYQDVNEVADAPVSYLIDTLGLAASAIDLLAETVSNARCDSARTEELALEYGVTTTELADLLVREAGLGFRAAHALCATFVRSGKDLGELRHAYRERTGKELTLGDERLSAALDPRGFAQARRLPGGPAPEGMRPVREALGDAMRGIARYLGEYASRKREASEELRERWTALGSRG